MDTGWAPLGPRLPHLSIAVGGCALDMGSPGKAPSAQLVQLEGLGRLRLVLGPHPFHHRAREGQHVAPVGGSSAALLCSAEQADGSHWEGARIWGWRELGSGYRGRGSPVLHDR